MAADSTTGRSPASRKFRRLGIAVAIVATLYSAGWFTVASKIETYLAGVIADKRPYDLDCPGLSTGGFPFLIGFTCNTISVSDANKANQLVAGAFRVVARIYAPGQAVVEIDGPGKAALEDGTVVDASWGSLRASFSAGLDRLKSFSADGKDIDATLNSQEFFRIFAIKASEGQLHLRQNNGDLEAAFLARDFEFGEPGEPLLLPKLSTSTEITLAGQADLLSGKRLQSKVMKGDLKSFRIETPDGLYGELTGPFTINAEGYISGTFVTRLEKLDLWESTLIRYIPAARTTINGMAALLKGLAKGEDKVTVNLEVRDGTITLSMFPVGHIPPI